MTQGPFVINAETNESHRDSLCKSVTLAFCEPGKMNPIKRKRDTEYQYDQQDKPVGSVENPLQAKMTPVSGPPSNDHVANLLAQARMSGLLPSNGTGVSPPSAYTPMSGPLMPGSSQSVRGAVDARGIPRYSQREQQQPENRENRNDTKRRKLNNNKASFKKAAQRPKSKQPTSTTSRKKGQKLPGKVAVDDSYVENLIAEALSTPSGPYAPSSNAIPKFPSIPKPENYPPALPPIHNKALEQQCFTHPSYIHDPANKDSTSSSLHYERLEFLGDSYMNYCVTKILYNRLPGLREGELTRFRSQIISNDNIRHYAMMYGFQDRILLSIGAENDDVREQGKKIADIFEAYIGGILTDQPDTGEQVVFKWMSEITAPQINETEKVARMILNVNKNAKQQLYVLLDAERAPAPTYVVTREGSTNTDYEVACLVQGKEMGRGVGKNKNDAGTRAAMQALEKLMKKRSASQVEKSDKISTTEDATETKKLKKKSSGESSSEESSSDESLSEGEIEISSG